MMHVFKVFAVLTSIVISLGICSAQVSTGTPPFGSFGGGPFDTVNLGNLNVHVSVPVWHKAGRGIPFTYDLSYDSSVWYPVGVSGNQNWVAMGNWGWRGQTEVTTGYVSYDSVYSGPACYNAGTYLGQQYTQSNWTYHDSFGTAHVFSGSTVRYMGAAAYCPPDTSLSVTAGDGSGWRMFAIGISLYNVTSNSGEVIHPPVNVTGAAGTATDGNGNQVSADGSGHFFDTLSSTTPVLAVTGSGTPASPRTL